jgi:hypothetical protein
MDTDGELVADAEVSEDRGESAAGTDSAEPSEDAPRRRRRRRGGRGRRRRTDAPGAATDAPAGDLNITVEHVDVEAEEIVEAKAPAPARIPSRRQPKLPAPPPAPIEVPPTVRTGSTDRHLMHDEPVIDEVVIDEPVRRPRSYRDLDQIPDDME